MKRTISIILVLAALFSAVTVYAAGTQSNPLITKSYTDGTFKQILGTFVVDRFAVSPQLTRVKAAENSVGFNFAAGNEKLTLSPNDEVILPQGSSFMLSTGSATVSFTGGSVINISTGTTVRTGSALTRNQQYFCGEGTVATVRITANATGYADGYYKLAKSPLLSTKYNVSGSYVYGITPSLSVSNFIAGLSYEGFQVVVVNSSGLPKTSGAVVTGDRIRVMSGGMLVTEFTLVMRGDMSGSGTVVLADLLALRKHLTGMQKLTGHWFIAGDLNRDNNINLQDLLILRKYLLKIGTIEF